MLGRFDQRPDYYELPQGRADFVRDWMTVAEAARRWEMPPTTARRYIERNRERLGAKRVKIDGHRGSYYRLCVPRGAERPPLLRRGNPAWMDSERQRELSLRRWQRGETDA